MPLAVGGRLKCSPLVILYVKRQTEVRGAGHMTYTSYVILYCMFTSLPASMYAYLVPPSPTRTLATGSIVKHTPNVRQQSTGNRDRPVKVAAMGFQGTSSK